MNHVLNIPVEVQEKSFWCWAAVSTMAVKSFSDDADLAQMTQLRTVAYSRRDVRTKSDLTPAMQLKVDDSETRCAKPEKCNGPGGVPWLFEVQYTAVPKGKKLVKQRLIDEILADRPVIVMWDYTKVDRSAGNLPASTHYLIITGYDDVTDQFRVFDPWPTLGPIPDPPEVHEHYVSYEGYADPQVSLGLPVSAVHEMDCYNLRRMTIGAEEVAPPDEDFDPVVESQDVMLEAVDFDEILRLDHDIQVLARRRVVYTHDGSAMSAPRRAGEAFPIVALTTQQLVEAHAEPHRLLMRRAWALMAPVIVGSEGRVVDSFQMYRSRGKWQEGGYSNSRIAQLLIKGAERLRREARVEGRVYLVSIPEQVMFFAAGGEAESAKLISLDHDANGPVLTGKEALIGVLKFIDSNRESMKDRDPKPLR